MSPAGQETLAIVTEEQWKGSGDRKAIVGAKARTETPIAIVTAIPETVAIVTEGQWRSQGAVCDQQEAQALGNDRSKWRSATAGAINSER